MKTWKLVAALLAAALLCGMSLSAYASDSESTSISGDKIYFGVLRGWKEAKWDAIAKKHTPNTVSNEQTISAQGITTLLLDTERCGVSVEPSATSSFELSYIGVSDSTMISVVPAVNGSILKLNMKGNKRLNYINADPKERVNVVLLKIPATVKGIGIDAESGALRVDGLSIPVSGETDNAMLTIAADKLSGGYQLAAEHGRIELAGKTVSGKVDLTAENGMVKISAAAVTGDVRMATENGMVKILADSLDGAALKTENGMIKLDVGTITGNVGAVTENGMVKVNLRKQPVNLSLTTTSSASGMVSLPSGWKNGSVFGTGSPALSLTCENGAVKLTTLAAGLSE